MAVPELKIAKVVTTTICLLWTNLVVAAHHQPVCFYVNSYHKGYTWSDGIERGLRSTLENKCEIIQVDMDTLNNQSDQEGALAGRAAYEMMKTVKPDVVITSDDSAAKYFMMPFVKESSTPVVFSGINWTIDEYDLPASNVTGIIEIAPVQPMLYEGLQIVGTHRNAGNKIAYLGANTLSERKNYGRINAEAMKLGLVADAILVDNFNTWQFGFELAQKYDLIILGSHAGIDKWDRRAAMDTAEYLTRKLTMTNHEWMMPYTVLGYTKVPEEHGEWAAASALAIISGIKVSEIPIVTNSRWDTWVNRDLLASAQIELKESMLRNAKIFK